MDYKDLSPEEFKFKDCIVAGDECVLITPKDMGTKWTKENARFRSCIVRKSDGKCISQSFSKFKNWGEDPEFQPWDLSWPVDARHKLDGSTIILSVHNGEVIARTRGTENSSTQETGPEVYSLINKYPKILDFPFVKNGNLSVLFEHTTPNRIIVLREHNVPTLTLLGVIYNENAILMGQDTVDKCAELWKIERPKKYSYSSVSECIADVEAWKGREGVVLYSPDGNTLKKIKAAAYLELHKIATGINNINQVVDLFMSTEKFTTYGDFYKYVETSLDYEIAEKIKDDMLLVVNAYNCVLDNLQKINKFVDGLRGESFDRKSQAIEITKRWSDWRAGVSFKILDNKEIEEKFIRKGIEFCLEKQKNETRTP